MVNVPIKACSTARRRSPPDLGTPSAFAGRIKIEEPNSVRYTVILERENDGGYVAIVPALPGCVSQGDTHDEVLRNIREAADLYIEDCIAAGDPVP
jgi:predicted RNase H-like HicB family nuclease